MRTGSFHMSIQPNINQLLLQHFSRIFVVTLPRLSERHEYIRDQLRGLNYDFFYGADKLMLTKDFIRSNYDGAKAKKFQRQGKGLNEGEVACSLSHRMLYEAMIRYDWQKVLVLEDDVLPLQENLDQLAETLQELPDDWELVYLGYLKHETIKPVLRRKHFFYKLISSLGLMRWSRRMVNNFLPRPFSKHLRRAGFHDCTHAYALTLAAAKKLLEHQTPVVYRADDLLSHTILKGELNAFITDPKFFDQESFHQPGIISEIR
jgi:glycosyl transferase family 25